MTYNIAVPNGWQGAAPPGLHNIQTGNLKSSAGTVGPYLYDAVLPPGTVGTPYSQTLTGGGGASPYTFALATGSSLPAGLTLSSSGILSGTPTATGTSTFSVKVMDSNGSSGSQSLSLTITTAVTPIVVTSNYGYSS